MDPLLAFALLVVIETLAAQSVLPLYYRLGLPLFYAARPLPPADPLPDMGRLAAGLSAAFRANERHPTIRFTALSERDIALSERLFENRPGLKYLPILHSRLLLDAARRRMVIVGYLNLSILAALAYAIYRSLLDRTFIPVAVLIVIILALSYLSQVAVNQRVLRAAVE